MRCDCCNNVLNDYEATNKDTGGRYLGTCNRCLSGLGIDSIGRPDLNPNDVPDDEFDPLEDEFVDDFDTEEWDE